jgi:hypothetical protein
MGGPGPPAQPGQSSSDGLSLRTTTIDARTDWVSWLVDAANLTQ